MVSPCSGYQRPRQCKPMSQLTRDYKGEGRRPPHVSGMKEFALGVLAGALLAAGGATLIVAHARLGQRGAAGSICAARSGTVTRDPGRPAVTSQSTPRSTPEPASQSAALAPSGSAAGGGPSAAPKQAAAPAPQYDFYQMLPKLTVPVAGAGASPTRHAERPAAAPAEYVLQVGSYGSDAEARRLRERLASLGVYAQIQRITQHGRTLNRVRIGPIDAAELVHIRGKLASAGIRPLVIPAGP